VRKRSAQEYQSASSVMEDASNEDALEDENQNEGHVEGEKVEAEINGHTTDVSDVEMS
jgi:hypothetical protein